ncbi:hypothetical protein DICA3_D04192 [Diutina catenulata]
MNALRATTLKQVAALAGVPARSTKAATAEAISDAIKLATRISEGPVAGIDIGIKNFSYCLINPHTLEVTAWAKLDLDVEFGRDYAPIAGHDVDNAIDSRRYLLTLAQAVAARVLAYAPSALAVETQRTQSNQNQRTLPAILRNYTLEALVVREVWPRVVWPVTSGQMANYWLNRYIPRSALPKNSKALRARIVMHLLEVSKSQLLNMAGLQTGKVDDLCDSYLYARGLAEQLSFCRKLATRHVDVDEITALVEDEQRRKLDAVNCLGVALNSWAQALKNGRS